MKETKKEAPHSCYPQLRWLQYPETGNSRAQCEEQSSGISRTTTDSSNGSLDSGRLSFTKIRSIRQQFENTKSELRKPTATRASCRQEKEFEKKQRATEFDFQIHCFETAVRERQTF